MVGGLAVFLGPGCTTSERVAPLPSVRLVVDENVVGSWQPVPGKDVLPLEAVLPKGAPDRSAWTGIVALGSEDRRFSVSLSADGRPGLQIRLYVEAGQPTLRVSQPPRPDLPPDVQRSIRKSDKVFSGLREIHILTRAASPKKKPGLSLVLDGTVHILSHADLEALPISQRTGRARKRGWSLADVIALGTPLSGVSRIRVEGDCEAPVEIRSEELRDGSFLLRRNRKGQLRFREWTAPGEPGPRSCRNVQRIVVSRAGTSSGGFPEAVEPKPVVDPKLPL